MDISLSKEFTLNTVLSTEYIGNHTILYLCKLHTLHVSAFIYRLNEVLSRGCDACTKSLRMRYKKSSFKLLPKGAQEITQAI